ncbi:hypothetical protein [Flammeovirga sp. SubArs3]|uniref:hypothetical protein n=1 Tax=Flammeovirga sp. SubArs3 TaxID=2995316 RepID=UPI00248CF991|nr:hypothetical protein [Flammeovirga sp. SubArs3]
MKFSQFIIATIFTISAFSCAQEAKKEEVKEVETEVEVVEVKEEVVVENDSATVVAEEVVVETEEVKSE